MLIEPSHLAPLDGVIGWAHPVNGDGMKTDYQGPLGKQEWPTVPDCFNCDKQLLDFRLADNNGQWRAYCKACDMFTWFDKETV